MASSYSALPREFFEPSADVVAPLLLGHWLLRSTPEGLCGGLIVETEAYLSDDPSCHAYRRETPRNRTMWGSPGHSYVYLIYGCYFCFNAVCRPRGIAEAVLVRAIEPTLGTDLMQQNRAVATARDLTSGPGKLCAALDIHQGLDGVDLCTPQSPLFIASNPKRDEFVHQSGPMITTTRIGITLAADWPLRYYLDGSPFVSRRAAKSALSTCS